MNDNVFGILRGSNGAVLEGISPAVETVTHLNSLVDSDGESFVYQSVAAVLDDVGESILKDGGVPLAVGGHFVGAPLIANVRIRGSMSDAAKAERLPLPLLDAGVISWFDLGITRVPIKTSAAMFSAGPKKLGIPRAIQMAVSTSVARPVNGMRVGDPIVINAFLNSGINNVVTLPVQDLQGWLLFVQGVYTLWPRGAELGRKESSPDRKWVNALSREETDPYGADTTSALLWLVPPYGEWGQRLGSIGEEISQSVTAAFGAGEPIQRETLGGGIAVPKTGAFSIK